MSGGLSFLAALFGGAYWGTKYSNDKTSLKEAHSEYDSVHSNDESVRFQWESKVINKEIESDLEEKIYQSNAEIISELEKTWNDYYESEFPKLFIPKKIGGRLLDTDTSTLRALTALRILMANRGLLTYHDAVIGFDIFANGETTAQMVENHKIQTHFITQVNEKLKNHGMDYPMYFEGINHLLYPFPGSYNIFSGSVFVVGKVRWRPEIPSFTLQDSYRRLKESEYIK